MNKYDVCKESSLAVSNPICTIVASLIYLESKAVSLFSSEAVKIAFHSSHKKV